MPDLASYIEQSTEAVKVVEQRNLEATEQLNELVKTLSTFDEIEESIKNLMERISDANEALDEIEEKLQKSADDAEESIDNIKSSAKDLNDEAKSATEDIESSFEEALDALREAADNLDKALDEAREAAEEHEKKLDESTEKAEAKKEEANESSQKFQEKADEFQEGVEENHGSLIDQITSMFDEVDTRMQGFGDMFGNVMSLGSDVLDQISSKLEEKNNESSESLASQFIGTALPALLGIGGNLGQTMFDMADFMSGPMELLDGGLGDVIDKVDEILSIVEMIEPVLEMCGVL